jgi:pimeloyl-ACP methyl ester carboxylesterase
MVAGLLLAVLGCSFGISVRRAAGPGLHDAWRASAIEAGDLSPRTRQTLRRWDLESAYQHRPADAYARLQALAVQDPTPDPLFSLAEIGYLLGTQAEKWESHAACVYYYLCAGYAYHYLFDDPSRTGNVFDPRFRLACDLYNTSLAKCIRAAQRIGRLDPRQQLHLPGAGGFTLSVVHHGFPWPPEEFGPLLFSGDFEVVGLANQYRGYGLGVAMIGTRQRTAQSEAAPGHAFYPDQVSFPVTAFFRFEGSVADLGARRSGQLELYNPLAVQSVTVKGRAIPLETDLTTPLAYFLAHSDLEGIEYTGFLNANKVQSRAGIYMFEPYQPGKIPVIMVHGLLSSPLTWGPMFNDLRADPTLRRHFQFWFYLYPTGNPFLATAADLRQDLARLRAELDPLGRDPALDQMVFVGHSMGGLIAKLMTTGSGEDFWRLVSHRPLEALQLPPATRSEIQPIFFFPRQPFVRRVVFIGTPHYGSALSPSWPAQLVARFIQLPDNLTKAAQNVAQEHPHLRGKGLGRVPNSVDSLAPGSPALELLAARPKPPGVHYHSIIGDYTGKGPDGGTDGVVPYRSAHLDGVDSELVIPGIHTTLHHQPGAVLEVWRILLEHLREVYGRDVLAGPIRRHEPPPGAQRPGMPLPRIAGRPAPGITVNPSRPVKISLVSPE